MYCDECKDQAHAALDQLEKELEANTKDGNRLADALVKSREEVAKLKAIILCQCPSCFYHKECYDPENVVFVKELRRSQEGKATV